jgi:hypothetical protein
MATAKVMTAWQIGQGAVVSMIAAGSIPPSCSAGINIRCILSGKMPPSRTGHRRGHQAPDICHYFFCKYLVL